MQEESMKEISEQEPLEIKICDLLDGITTINSANEYRYKEIKEALDKAGDRKIILDFHYIELAKPENNQDFLDIITDSRIFIRLYNNNELYKTIKFILLLSNIDSDSKVENIIKNVAPPPTRWDKEKERIFNFINGTYILEDGIGKIKLCDEISVINRNPYIQGISDVIHAHKDETNTFELYMYGMEIVKTQLETLASLIVELTNINIELRVLTNDDEVDKIVKTYLNLGKNKNLSVRERIKLLEEMIPIKTAGMLTTYKKGGKRDIFGRYGNAEPVKTLPAIYKGHDDEYAHFTVYRQSAFSRRLEYELRNDGETHPGLSSYDYKVKIKELGICAGCIGSRYHFNMPIQFDKEGMQSIYRDTPDGDFEVIQVSIPQFLKMVFDDWDIDYNSTELSAAIKVTKDRLRKIGVYL